jgi:hypothetical protein
VPGFKVCDTMLKYLLRNTSNSLARGLDRIGREGLKVWFFFLDPSGFCDLINTLIETELLPVELKLVRVAEIPRSGKCYRTSVKSCRYISVLPTIAKLVEKAITLYLSIQGEIHGWWHLGQHGSRAGRNTTDVLLWVIRKVRENRAQKSTQQY